MRTAFSVNFTECFERAAKFEPGSQGGDAARSDHGLQMCCDARRFKLLSWDPCRGKLGHASRRGRLKSQIPPSCRLFASFLRFPLDHATTPRPRLLALHGNLHALQGRDDAGLDCSTALPRRTSSRSTRLSGPGHAAGHQAVLERRLPRFPMPHGSRSEQAPAFCLPVQSMEMKAS